MKSIIIYDDRSSFVEQDIDLLNADEFHFTKNYLKQFLFFLTHRYDRYIVYFCNSKAIIPILFSRLYWGRSIIFVGGYDATYIPEIDYGVFKSWFRGIINILCYKTAHKIVISSGWELGIRLNEYVNVNYKVIEPAVDTEYWKPRRVKRIIDYITVGAKNSQKRKGIDKFLDLAHKYPYKLFVAINCGEFEAPDNVMRVDRVERDELREFYNKSKVYCQFSVYESFGIALVEAMSMGCLPMVNNVGVMGELSKGVTTRKKARERAKQYDISVRKEKLCSLLA